MHTYIFWGGNAMLVMTYNIQSGRDIARRLDLSGSENVIRSLKPDVCVLNEVRMRTRDTGFQEQARLLGENLGMDWRFFKAMDYDGGDYGVGFLSRPAIGETKYWVVPQTDTLFSENRIIFRCPVVLDGRPVAVYGTHFGLSDTDLDNATDLAERILSEETGPALFMGDLNMRPDDKRIARLCAHIANTAPGEPFFSFPSDVPDRKIDYIFASRHFRLVRTFTHPTQASDHLPLLAELTWA